MQTTDKKMFLDMQEHPEKYSDQQIEVMLDELDRVPDVESAWQKFSAEQEESTESTQNHIHTSHRWLKVAASFIGVLLVTGLAYAAFRILSPAKEQQRTEVSTLNSQRSSLNYSPDGFVLFADIRLDSMLAIVSRHYSKIVSFSNEELKGLRIHTKWNQEDSLAAFIGNLNELDELQLTELRDTIFVQKGGVQ